MDLLILTSNDTGLNLPNFITPGTFPLVLRGTRFAIVHYTDEAHVFSVNDRGEVMDMENAPVRARYEAVDPGDKNFVCGTCGASIFFGQQCLHGSLHYVTK